MKAASLCAVLPAPDMARDDLPKSRAIYKELFR